MAKILQTQFLKGSLIEKVSNTAFAVTGSPVFKETEKGMGLEFGSGKRLSLPASTLLANRNKFTLVAWVKDRKPTNNTILAWEQSPTLRIVVQLYSDNKWYITVGNGANSYIYWTDTDITNIKHLVIIYDGSQALSQNRLKAYINGNLQAVVNGGGTVATSTPNITQPIYIGYSADGYGDNTINQVYVDDTIFTQSDINKDYAKFLKSSNTKKAKRVLKMKPNDLSNQKLNKTTNIVITNGGSIYTTDRVDTDGNGLADNWSNGSSGACTASIVTGNGFTGRAQRFERTSGVKTFAQLYFNGMDFGIGKTYKISFKQRNNQTFRVLRAGAQNWINPVAVNTGNAITTTGTFVADGISTNLSFYLDIATSIGAYLEISDVKVEEYSGCVAAYNMTLQQGKLNDISGNNNVATPVNCNSSLNGILFQNGKNGYVNIPSSITTDNLFSGGGSIIVDHNPVTTGQGNYSCIASKAGVGGKGWFLGGNGGTQWRFIMYYSGGFYQWLTPAGTWSPGRQTMSVTYNANTSANNPIIKINGVTQTLTKNTSGGAWAYTSDAGTTIRLGNEAEAADYDGEINDIRFYKRIITDAECTNFHNSKINTYIEDFSNNGANGVSCLPEGRSQISGTRKIGEEKLADGNRIVTNAGSIYTTDRVDTNGDGIADTRFKVGTPTCTIVTGNGFTGRAQRCVAVNGGTSDGIAISSMLTVGKEYKMTFKYRSDSINALQFYNGGSIYVSKASPNTGNAIPYTIYFTAGFAGINFYTSTAGQWFEISDIVVTGVQGLPVGTKYVESISASKMVTYKPNALGEFEIAFYKTDNSSPLGIFVNGNGIQDYNNVNNKGYVLYVEGSYMDYYRTYVANLQRRQSAGAIQFGVWYMVKRTLTNAGVHTWYIKGGQYGNTYTLVTGPWIAGGNPSTDTLNIGFGGYLQIQHGAGDRVALIKDKDSLPA